MTIRFPILAALCVGVMQLLADDPGREMWSSPWMEVTPQNGVKDDYYPLPRDAADGSFRFRFSRNASNLIGIEKKRKGMPRYEERSKWKAVRGKPARTV